MFQRVLWISLTQAIRSVLLVLIPLSAIALIAWSTAGSAEPNTTDPIRAALWLWLGAHHIPFNLNLPPGHVAGFLSYLPIGALLFPVIAIRSSMKRIYSATDYSQEARWPAQSLSFFIRASLKSQSLLHDRVKFLHHGSGL